MPLAPIALHTDGAIAATAVPWRFRGRLQLTVVVKATFTLVPGGVAALAAPRDVVR